MTFDFVTYPFTYVTNIVSFSVVWTFLIVILS